MALSKQMHPFERSRTEGGLEPRLTSARQSHQTRRGSASLHFAPAKVAPAVKEAASSSSSARPMATGSTCPGWSSWRSSWSCRAALSAHKAGRSEDGSGPHRPAAPRRSSKSGELLHVAFFALPRRLRPPVPVAARAPRPPPVATSVRIKHRKPSECNPYLIL